VFANGNQPIRLNSHKHSPLLCSSALYKFEICLKLAHNS